MAPLLVKYEDVALAFLETVPKKHRKQIIAKIDALALNPRTLGTKQLHGIRFGQDARRERSGDYRILYTINKNVLFVTDIGNRKDVYR